MSQWDQECMPCCREIGGRLLPNVEFCPKVLQALAVSVGQNQNHGGSTAMEQAPLAQYRSQDDLEGYQSLLFRKHCSWYKNPNPGSVHKKQK